MDFTAILLSASIPSAVVGLGIWLLEKKIDKRERGREAQAEKQEKLQLIMLDGLNASLELGEATARAVQRIPDAHCNGDMHAALDRASVIKRHRDALIEAEGIANILH